MKKHSPTRLFRTLGYLVVCMTVGVALLSVAQPTGPPTDPPPENRCSPVAAVADISIVPARLWRDVVVHCPRGPASSPGPLLSAAGPAGGVHDYHFLVQPDGRIIASSAWRQQKPIGTDRLGLHIALGGGRISTMIPRLQWNAFRELLGQLQRRFRLDPARIRLAETSDRDSGLIPPAKAARFRNLLWSVRLAG